MEYFENLILMKKLLRQGWVRAGIPQGSIESLADHCWSVAVLTYTFATLENDLRGPLGQKIDIEKAVLIALFHDFPESEYFDIDKTLYELLDKNKVKEFLRELEEGAIQNLTEKFPFSLKRSLYNILNDQQSEEYHIARIADFFDLLIQTREYEKKKWLDKNQTRGFQAQAQKQLKAYEERFKFLKQSLEGLNRIK